MTVSYIMIDPSCTENECFAYENGHCTCLRDNDFGKRKCPFYKTSKQRKTELKRCKERLESLERGDLYANR